MIEEDTERAAPPETVEEDMGHNKQTSCWALLGLKKNEKRFQYREFSKPLTNAPSQPVVSLTLQSHVGDDAMEVAEAVPASASDGGVKSPEYDPFADDVAPVGQYVRRLLTHEENDELDQEQDDQKVPMEEDELAHAQDEHDPQEEVEVEEDEHDRQEEVEMEEYEHDRQQEVEMEEDEHDRQEEVEMEEDEHDPQEEVQEADEHDPQEEAAFPESPGQEHGEADDEEEPPLPAPAMPPDEDEEDVPSHLAGLPTPPPVPPSGGSSVLACWLRF